MSGCECKPDRAQPSRDMSGCECKPDAKRVRDSAKPPVKSQPSKQYVLQNLGNFPDPLFSRSFQKPGHHYYSAEENPCGVGPDITTLHVPQATAGSANQAANPVYGTIDHETIDK